MVSKLILGTAQIGMNYGINNKNGKISIEDAFKIFNYAYQSGIQYLDTAPVYGDAQKIIGQFHKLNPNIKFKIITKIPSGYAIEDLEQLVDSFLIEMNVSKIDLLHFHSSNDYLNADPKSLNDIILQLKRLQKVQSFGVSIYENSEVNNISRTLIDVIQLPFNLLDNINLRGDLIYTLKKRDFIVHTRSAFLQGLFFTDPNKINDDEIKNFLNSITLNCRNYNLEIEELALQYCISQNEIDFVLIGVDCLKHLQKNISIANKKIQIETFQNINNIKISNTSQLNPTKWKIG